MVETMMANSRIQKKNLSSTRPTRLHSAVFRDFRRSLPVPPASLPSLFSVRASEALSVPEVETNVERCWRVRSTRCQKRTVHFPLDDRLSGKTPWAVSTLGLSM